MIARGPCEVSVIVPAYNVAEHLGECLDSIVHQSFPDIEVIVVDDGSTDATGRVMAEYAERYGLVRAITQENAGVAAARNRGLDEATGRFVCFLDGDDRMAPDAIAHLHRRMLETDADMVVGDYLVFDDSHSWRIPAVHELLAKRLYHPTDPALTKAYVVWNRMYRRSLIEEHGIRFAPLTFAEDAVFVMHYVHASRFIATVDADICHYRRRSFAGELQATQVVTVRSERDHLKAHRLVAQSATKRLSADYDYFGASSHHFVDERIRSYMEAIVSREVTNIVHARYANFWSAEKGVAKLIAERVARAQAELSFPAWMSLVRESRGLALDALPRTKLQGTKNPVITVALSGTAEEADDFAATLRSIYTQRFCRFLVLVPEAMLDLVPEELRSHENLSAVEGDTVGDFRNAVLAACRSEFVLFSEPGILYRPTAISQMHERLHNNNLDFVTCPVSHVEPGVIPHVMTPQRLAFTRVRSVRSFAQDGAHELDCLLPNKLFRTAFLRAQSFTFVSGPADARRLYQRGYFLKSLSRLVYTQHDEATFTRRYLGSHAAHWRTRFAARIALNALATPFRRWGERLNDRWGPTPLLHLRHRAKHLVLMRLAAALRLLPVADKVFFYSIRADGRLTDNAKWVWDALDVDRKVFLSHRIPHRAAFKLRTYYHLLTSKVIVTDDYLRYLRTISLQPEQRVIQLWHASGAFKAFGLDGGPHSSHVELLTHRQYDAVLTSAEHVRRYYAHAFGIEIDKTTALGVPRTDFYFDPKALERARAEVYRRYPRLREKQVIVYAPTFRDAATKKGAFDTRIDFADLSASLSADQIMVICPHPLIEEPLLGTKTYPNIIEVNDIPTGDMVLAAHLVVTDYSTVIFDFALLNGAFVFYCPDLDEYDRPFYFDFPTDLPSPVFTDHASLRDYLSKGDFRMDAERMKRFVGEQVAACDGQSSVRAAALIKQYLAE